MDIHIQSDGQLYNHRHREPQMPPPPPPKKEPPKEPPCPKEQENHWEDFLLIAIGFILLRDKNHTDIPLLLALAYVLFDSCFSLEKLL